MELTELTPQELNDLLDSVMNRIDLLTPMLRTFRKESGEYQTILNTIQRCQTLKHKMEKSYPK